MKKLFIGGLVIIFLSCSKQNSDNKTNTSNTVSTNTDSVTIQEKSSIDEHYLTSTYDDPGNDLEQHKASLRELSDSSAFSIIHKQIISTLNKKHQDYFNSNSDYEIIYSSSGDLFQNGKRGQCVYRL